MIGVMFITDVYDDQKLIWKKSYIYRVEYEDEICWYLSTESGILYALDKTNYRNVARIFQCDNTSKIFCNHCNIQCEHKNTEELKK